MALNPPTLDMRDVLVNAGVGTFAATSGWGIYIGSEPTSPNTVITLYDTGGLSPNPVFLLDFPTFQVRVRGNPNDYLGAYNKILGVRDVLLGFDSQDINTTRYDGVWQSSEIVSLGTDKERFIFVANFRVAREPSSAVGTNRRSM